MTRFSLVVMPNGKAVLTTREALSPRYADQIRQAYDAWSASDGAKTLIIVDCDVVQVVDIELDIDGKSETPPL